MKAWTRDLLSRVLSPLGPMLAATSILFAASCASTPDVADRPADPRPANGQAAESEREAGSERAVTPVRPESLLHATRTRLTLLGTTDVHNRLYPYDYYTGQEIGYGLARLKPIIDSIRAANPGRTYLFDSGDLLQGNPLSVVYARELRNQPHPVIRAMNILDYNAAAIGNHEYNYGIAHLEKALKEARFPFVSGNTFKHGTNEHAYRPYVLLPHVVAAGDTILIGVTGNTPPGVEVWDRQNVAGTLDFRDVVASLKPMVAEMKSRGVDVVVVLSHGGFEGTSYDTATTGLPPENAGARLAREVPDIDVVFLGHTHRELADSIINGVLFTQARNWGQSLARVEIELERRAASDWHVVSKHGAILRPLATRADTAFLDSLRWEHERTVEWVNSIAGRSVAAYDASRSRIEDTPIIDFVNEVMRRRANADLSATAAFSISSKIPAGDVTIADIAGLYIYDNTLKAIRITGAQLKAYLEKSAEYFNTWPAERPISNTPGYNFDVISGIDYTIDVSKPIGKRITQLTFKGSPVRPGQTFTMALNNYRQAGGGGFGVIADAPVVYDRQEDIRELLIDEFRQHGTIDLRSYFTENWRLAPVEAKAAIQRELDREVRRPISTLPPTSAPNSASSSPPSASSVLLRVLAQNDVHGRLHPETYPWSDGRLVGGAAAVLSFYRHERAGIVDAPTIVLDGGDVMQGTPISNLTSGRSMVEYFNLGGITAAALGNHDFDWGQTVLRERIEQARFPWLSANIVVAGTDTAPSWIRGTTMVEVQGVKVGIIGLSTQDTPDDSKPENIRGLEFTDGAAAIDRWVPVLRQQGADFVIVTAHSGVVCDRGMTNCRDEMIDWARRVTHRPDLIVAGHTHQTINTVENGIRIVESQDYGKRYTVVDLEKRGDSVRVWVRGQPTTFNDIVQPDSAGAALVERYEREIGPIVDRVVASLAEPLRKRGRQYELGNLIADAQRAATGAQIAIMNNGGIRTELQPGELTWGELYQLQPFGNRLIRLQLTGAQVLETLERLVRAGEPGMHISGLIVEYDTTRAPGSRIVNARLSDGTALRPDALYAVTVNDFLASGGDGMTVFTRARKQEQTGIVDLDALIEYLRQQPQPVRVQTGPRFRLVTRQESR